MSGFQWGGVSDGRDWLHVFWFDVIGVEQSMEWRFMALTVSQGSLHVGGKRVGNG